MASHFTDESCPVGQFVLSMTYSITSPTAHACASAFWQSMRLPSHTCREAACSGVSVCLQSHAQAFKDRLGLSEEHECAQDDLLMHDLPSDLTQSQSLIILRGSACISSIQQYTPSPNSLQLSKQLCSACYLGGPAIRIPSSDSTSVYI